MATELFPIITTANLERALGFYRDLLGGTVSYDFPGPDGQPAYVGLDLGTSHLGIGHNSGLDEPPGRRLSLWIYVDDCRATIETLRGAGIEIVEEPADQPWGQRAASGVDLNAVSGHESPVGGRPRKSS